ncbi:class III poly(R)-hydroxyalkanoic acid synthase subunit PhaE [Leptolyngbyaceae cyanobacterium UHCC 1019]
MANAWQDFFPKFEPGEDWQQALNQTFNHLWGKALEASIDSLSKTAISTSKPWITLNHLYWNLIYEKTLGQLTQMPLLGPSREFNHTLMQAFDAWAKLYPTNTDYQLVMAEIHMQSLAELIRELNSLAAKGEKVEDWQQFQQLWSRIADRVFEQAFCLEDNLKVRGRLLNATNYYKLRQQELMELWMKSLNLPTRSEVDEVHKNIYELRKEVKTLKKTLTQHEVQAQAYLSESKGLPPH